MPKNVLIIGGYGNFGSFISQELAKNPDIQVIIAGRSQEKAEAFCDQLDAVNPPIATAFDVYDNLSSQLAKLDPFAVIHTVGPFQGQSYSVAVACIGQGCHYIDLADGRDFVSSIDNLNAAAIAGNVSVISGASSVPCLSSAVVDHFLPEFKCLTSLSYGIATAQHTTRGQATTEAVLSYAGQPFQTLVDGSPQTIIGWQGLRSHRFHELGKRYLANCDIPDLTLFPERYPTLKTVRFFAGLELAFIQIGLWGLSWLVRFRMIKTLASWAGFLLKTSFLFDRIGGDESGFFMKLSGQNNEGRAKSILFELTAKSGHGPFIPCIPAILLAEKMAKGFGPKVGATACIGLLTLEEYLKALEPLDITWTSS